MNKSWPTRWESKLPWRKGNEELCEQAPTPKIVHLELVQSPRVTRQQQGQTWTTVCLWKLKKQSWAAINTKESRGVTQWKETEMGIPNSVFSHLLLMHKIDSKQSLKYRPELPSKKQSLQYKPSQENDLKQRKSHLMEKNKESSVSRT